MKASRVGPLPNPGSSMVDVLVRSEPEMWRQDRNISSLSLATPQFGAPEPNLRRLGVLPKAIPEPQMASGNLRGSSQERPRCLGEHWETYQRPRGSQMPESFAPVHRNSMPSKNTGMGAGAGLGPGAKAIYALERKRRALRGDRTPKVLHSSLCSLLLFPLFSLRILSISKPGQASKSPLQNPHFGAGGLGGWGGP